MILPCVCRNCSCLPAWETQGACEWSFLKHIILNHLKSHPSENMCKSKDVWHDVPEMCMQNWETESLSTKETGMIMSKQYALILWVLGTASA